LAPPQAVKVKINAAETAVRNLIYEIPSHHGNPG